MLTLTSVTSVGEALWDTIVTHKTNVALIEADRHRENGRWNYRELSEEAKRFAALLADLKFHPGDRCAILMQNQSKWILSAVGALWSGATLVPLDYKLTPQEQLELIEHCQPRVLVTEYSAWLDLQAEATDPDSLPTTIVTEAPAQADLGSGIRWETAPQSTFRLSPRSRTDVATIVYSSGTSGTPKGCMLTHDNYLEQAQILGRLFPIEEDDRYFSVLPTNHAIDFMVGFIVPLLFGAAIVHQRTLRPQFLRASMKQYGITHMALVPTILKNLEKRIRERLDDLPFWQRRVVDSLTQVNEWMTARGPQHELSRWLLKPIHDTLGGKLRMIFAGGSWIDPSLAEFFYNLGVPVVIGYGLTEASTVVAVNDLKPFRADTVGRPVPGVEVDIRGANEEGIGEVWVRGPTVMQGYLDAPHLTEEAIIEGWLRTGDLGWLDAAGHLHLVGRVKNMIVTEGGKNIYPEDIEAAFEGLCGCEEYCVFAEDYIWPRASMTGERLIIVVRPDSTMTMPDSLLKELIARNKTLPDFKRVSGYVIRTTPFPATASLKIKRNVLAEELRELSRDDAVRSF